MVDNLNSKTSGFALLVSMIVVGVVLTVGLVILDLTIKQVQLAITTADSEVAFHAANAGVECARFVRRDQNARIIQTDATVSNNDLLDVSCFGAPDQDVSATDVSPSTGTGMVHSYNYQFTWGAAPEQRCTEIDMVTMVVDPFDVDPTTLTDTALQGIIPGYPTGADYTCPRGGECTILGVRGYNQTCPAGGTFDFGVVERKVLLEF